MRIARVRTGNSPVTAVNRGAGSHSSEVPDPQSLAVRAWLNGEVVQDGDTASTVFGVRDLACVSRFVKLRLGGVILTGTQAGCGDSHTPPVALAPGRRHRGHGAPALAGRGTVIE